MATNIITLMPQGIDLCVAPKKKLKERMKVYKEKKWKECGAWKLTRLSFFK